MPARSTALNSQFIFLPGTGIKANYGSPEYVEYFYKQLNELLTNYGDVFEIWFDGANGGDGWYGGAKDSRTIDRKTYYDYPRAYKLIDELQPQAVIFSDGGPGCRWVGNENGFAGATNWSFLRAGEVYPGYPKYRELQYGSCRRQPMGSRRM